MEPNDAKRLLLQGDPLLDGEPISVRLLAIDEAEEVREVLRAANIACQIRLVKPCEVKGWRGRDPHLVSEYSVVRPSWNVVVPATDLARARALCEQELRTDLDGRDDTAAVAAGGTAPPQPVPLVVLPWDQAWELEFLGRDGVRAAVGTPLGSLPIEEQNVPVLVLPGDVERARALVPPG